MDLKPYQVPYYRAVLGDASDNLPIIRPRFPSKVAYLFAKNYVMLDNNKVEVLKSSIKLIDISDKQYEQLKEIYASHEFINNLKLMKLESQEEIPIIDKAVTSEEVLEELNRLQLNQYIQWINWKD